MRRIVPACLVLITAGIIGGLFISCRIPAREETAAAGKIIRLHVIAHSDADADQAIKIAVRDAVLAEMAPYFRQTADAASARRVVRENLGRLEEIARRIMRQNGADYSVKAALGTFAFPTRIYGDLVLPAGDYEALRITLGAGTGQNWWCVLFPPLCFLDGAAVETAGEGGAAVSVVLVAEPDPSQIEIRFKLTEIWQESVNGWRRWREKLADATGASTGGDSGEKPISN